MTYEEALQAIPCGRYRHFKGNEYEVIAIARHSETTEPMVVYKALYGDHDIWIRPAEMWNETIERDGKKIKRFEKAGSMRIEDHIASYKNGGYIKEMRKFVGHAPILTCACGVIIENENGEILLQKRRDNGCWGIIGGSMEMGETFEETVRRETREESGLTLGKLEVFKLISGNDHIIEYPNGDVCFSPGIIFITKEYEGTIINDPEEVMEHRFFGKAELPDKLNRFDEDIILEWAASSPH